jgi:hypothetical protein
MNEQMKFAVDELYSWFRKNQEYFIEQGADITFIDKGRNSASVAVNGSKYLLDIVAWDHESCLDIAVMVVATEETKYIHTGDCANKNEFIEFLNETLSWYKKQSDNT